MAKNKDFDIFSLNTPEKVSKFKTQGKEGYVLNMSAFEKDLLEEQWTAYRREGSTVGVRAFFVAWCLCDKDGKRTYPSGVEKRPSSDFVANLNKIGGLSAQVIDPIFEAISKANAVSADDVGVLEKN